MSLSRKSIPKVIHYFWFGGNPLSPLAERCIESWERYMPDYEIKRWDESNFDVNITLYTRQAYESKRYAFVSDYARIWVMYSYGGVYFDTDVEVIRSFDEVLAKGPFIGLESTESGGVAPNLGLGFASLAGHDIYRELLESYREDPFIRGNGSQNLSTIVDRATRVLVDRGFKNVDIEQSVGGIAIYPTDYFCPKDFATGKLTITDNTHSIHWYDSSWQPMSSRLFYVIFRYLPKGVRSGAKSLVRKLRGVK